ncbi:ABC transporter ATP-binding protein [Oenococcus oeni]|uniref:ABC-type uncharacterized transport system, ATPase component n=14 Tax=Oenococcus oeni TaxID=1247 RepID=Q04H21_OENOB|nr:ATP-binding cassette domain-containing protein [Oenococcus oeni]EAV38800.1 ABC transporter, ATP-binding protein [Oenococcus oeni ATCC BAA-1163]MDI4584526.1 ATP-binding cassette domain-containing protein [Oenococcus sp. UCMA 14587]ABJ56251.1 ABC-type uncharacterized transport system, ATPase component [Oenococcus oeni PSU-1]AVI93569.1 ABC transporter ATP-binding protein [Oenococcus oeni]AWW98545.1 ABC transporter ATP-binding protein [Oenococcus oeni]
MTEVILSLKDVTVTVNKKQNNETRILKSINLDVHPGDFITILGSNGAGKSTVFNVISGTLPVDSGKILHAGQDISKESPEKRAKFLSRVFQDPKMGTSPRMTVAENLLLASKRGEKRSLAPRHMKAKINEFRHLASKMGNNLDHRLDTPTENLSGGQRQALSFLMATYKKPDVLLLDEHTAALDPKTSADLMEATAQRIEADHLTCLMITHHMEDALKYGNRLIVIENGIVSHDFNRQEKAALTKEKLLSFFDVIA